MRAAGQVDLILHCQHRLHHKPETAQDAKQFAVAEGLAAGGEADPLRRLLRERADGIGLQKPGLLIVAVAVYDAVRASLRTHRVHRIDRCIHPRIFARRHARL
jgi:hypothetical protein